MKSEFANFFQLLSPTNRQQQIALDVVFKIEIPLNFMCFPLAFRIKIELKTTSTNILNKHKQLSVVLCLPLPLPLVLQHSVVSIHIALKFHWRWFLLISIHFVWHWSNEFTDFGTTHFGPVSLFLRGFRMQLDYLQLCSKLMESAKKEQ